MIEQHAQLALGTGPKISDHRRQVIGAVQRFDNDAKVTEVVAPHMLEQLGIMLTLHPDAAGTSDTRAAVARDCP